MFDPVSAGIVVGGSILGSVGSGLIQSDSNRKAQHEAQGNLQSAEAGAMGNINAGYDKADQQYSLIDSIIKDHYSTARGDLTSGYGNAIGSTNAGYNAAKGQYQPWATSGQGAQNIMADLNGVNGTQAQQAAYQRMQFDPGYKFQVDQANQALQRSGLAQGNLFSGNFANALQKQNQGMASGEFNNYYNRLMGMSNTGLGASGAIAGLSADQGNALSRLYTGQGGALAANQENESGMLSNAAGTRASMAANRGTSLANAGLGVGSQMADYSYKGGINQGNAYANMMSGIGSGLNTAGGYYGTQQLINSMNAQNNNLPINQSLMQPVNSLPALPVGGNSYANWDTSGFDTAGASY